MARPLGGHRDEFSSDQFDALVRIENAGLHHPLHVGDGEGTVAARGDEDVHETIIALHQRRATGREMLGLAYLSPVLSLPARSCAITTAATDTSSSKVAAAFASGVTPRRSIP